MSVEINVISDVSCPWCYVGRKRLENAVKQCSGVKANIIYHPFIIDQGTKKDGEEYLAYNKRRWGGDGWVYSMKESAQRDGCSFAGWKYWPFSLHCHRLMCYANSVNKGYELMGEYFIMTYEEGKNLSLNKDLAEAAQRVGLDAAAVNEVLNSNKYEVDVISALHKWQKQGVSGVPHFLVTLPNGQVKELNGAIDTSTWVKLFNALK